MVCVITTLKGQGCLKLIKVLQHNCKTQLIECDALELSLLLLICVNKTIVAYLRNAYGT